MTAIGVNSADSFKFPTIATFVRSLCQVSASINMVKHCIVSVERSLLAAFQGASSPLTLINIPRFSAGVRHPDEEVSMTSLVLWYCTVAGIPVSVLQNKTSPIERTGNRSYCRDLCVLLHPESPFHFPHY
jgi:hypothetical protein